MIDKIYALAFIRKKKRKKIAALIASICFVGILILILLAFNVWYIDRFTITTINDPALCLTIDENKQQLTTELTAPPLTDATDTQYSKIPLDIDDGLGSKNTNQYFAYSFYLGAYSTSDSINYELSMTFDKASQDLEEAIRIMIIKNGIKTVYAKADQYGNAKPIYSGDPNDSTPVQIGTTVKFKENKHIILEPYKITPGSYDKYTVVMWIDGWDSKNDMKGGVFQSSIKFSTMSINK